MRQPKTTATRKLIPYTLLINTFYKTDNKSQSQVKTILCDGMLNVCSERIIRYMDFYLTDESICGTMRAEHPVTLSISLMAV